MSNFLEQAQMRNNLRTATLEDWRIANATLKAAKADEAIKRLALIELFSAHAAATDLFASMENVDLPNGETLKIQHKLDYKLDADGDKIEKILDVIEKSQEGGNVIAERLVKWKPELSVTEYKLLNPVQKALIDKVLTIKPASKSVEIKKG